MFEISYRVTGLILRFLVLSCDVTTLMSVSLRGIRGYSTTVTICMVP